jgi:hypothetical protein
MERFGNIAGISNASVNSLRHTFSAQLAAKRRNKEKKGDGTQRCQDYWKILFNCGVHRIIKYLVVYFAGELLS